MEIDRNDVDPFAQMMLTAYLATAADARGFTNEWGAPPTQLHKAHYFRSIVQAQVTQSSQYKLHPEYVEFGRVQVAAESKQWSWLIRSKSAIGIEESMTHQGQLELFSVRRRVATELPSLLAYNFARAGMGLWTCPTKKMPNRSRLIPARPLDFLGFWPFEAATPPAGGGGGITFDQGEPEAFDQLGDLNFDDFGES